MRENKQITMQEYEVGDNATLMSTTDRSSHITYANAAFNEVSGFSTEEMQGQPHNIVRHPSMPKEAFSDLWKTLKGGEPWTALVKNRRKNGEYYWVRANVVPIIRENIHEGYMSVRTKPKREDVEQAEALYKAMSEGRPTGRKLHKGVLLRTGVAGLLTASKTLSVRSRIRLNSLILWLGLIAGAWLLGGSDQFVGLAGLATVLSLVLCFALESQLARPLEQLRKQALDVATGNNRDVLNIDRVDEIGMTMRSISQLGLMFRWLINDVSEQVINVQQGINEIAQGNLDLSARTEQSAASVEQTASAMGDDCDGEEQC